MLLITMMAESDGQWNGEIADQFNVPGEVVEIRLSKGCEMQFLFADGSFMSSVDIEDVKVAA